MAEPGDPKPPETPEADVDHDAAIGFASSSSLQGQPSRAPEPPPEPEPEPDPMPEPELLFEAPAVERQPEPAPSLPPSPEPVPAWASETPVATPSHAGFGAHRREPVEVEGGLSLFSVYALILFAVPTLGVSALIALVAVTGRPAPSGAVAASHFVFQQRTLWIGALAALLGAVLIVVGLGVFVLFVLAVWLIFRGAAGVMKLKAGLPIPNPRTWLI